MQAATTFIRFIYNKRMRQDCKTQCLINTLFTWVDGHNSEQSQLPANSRCPKCTVVPYIAATIRTYVRACYDEVCLQLLPSARALGARCAAAVLSSIRRQPFMYL